MGLCTTKFREFSFFSMLWKIWKERCALGYDSIKGAADNILRRLHSSMQDLVTTLGVILIRSPRQQHTMEKLRMPWKLDTNRAIPIVKWEKPVIQMVHQKETQYQVEQEE